MFCENCNIEIPPAWIVVIAKNVCPACEGEIMSDETKELLDELRSAMERMPADPEGLAGWLLSNYNLRKIGTAEPTEFHRKMQRGQEQFPGLKIAENPKSVFLQRAGMGRELDRRKQSLSEIAQQIGSEDDGTVSVDLDAVDDFAGLDEYEALALRQSQLAQGASAKNTLHNNSLLIQGDGVPPNEMEAAMLAQALGTQANAPADDLPPALQADRYKRLLTQQEVAAGGTVGKIRR
jgi:hypothetical protein